MANVSTSDRKVYPIPVQAPISTAPPPPLFNSDYLSTSTSHRVRQDPFTPSILPLSLAIRSRWWPLNSRLAAGIRTSFAKLGSTRSWNLCMVQSFLGATAILKARSHEIAYSTLGKSQRNSITNLRMQRNVITNTLTSMEVFASIGRPLSLATTIVHP